MDVSPQSASAMRTTGSTGTGVGLAMEFVIDWVGDLDLPADQAPA